MRNELCARQKRIRNKNLAKNLQMACVCGMRILILPTIACRESKRELSRGQFFSIRFEEVCVHLMVNLTACFSLSPIVPVEFEQSSYLIRIVTDTLLGSKGSLPGFLEIKTRKEDQLASNPRVNAS